MLLLNITRKPYVGSRMTPMHLALSDIERKSQGHSYFEALYRVKEES